MIDGSLPERFGDAGVNAMQTRTEIIAEREALKRGNRKFIFAVLAVTITSALILYPTVGRAAGLALARILH